METEMPWNRDKSKRTMPIYILVYGQPRDKR